MWRFFFGRNYLGRTAQSFRCRLDTSEVCTNIVISILGVGLFIGCAGIYVYTHTRIGIYVYMHTYIGLSIGCGGIYMYMHTHTGIYVYMHTCICVYAHMYMCMCTHM